MILLLECIVACAVFTAIMLPSVYRNPLAHIMIFCHSTKTMIPGTEDMVAEYRSPWHHVRGFFIGQALGTIVALLAAGFVVLIF